MIDTFSYTHFGEPWTNAFWLSDILIFLTYRLGGYLGMALLTAAMAVLTRGVIYQHTRNSPARIRLIVILLAPLVSVALTPFLLPKMHDRYFYPADVMSILLAFSVPQFWFVPLCYQVISSLVYAIFLVEADRVTMLILFSKDVARNPDTSVSPETRAVI